MANSRTLFYAARHAGVQRIVHVSITHPSITSPYPYFRGKAEVERVLAEVGVSYAVLRPAILFGGDGVLLNNIAWLLRHLPVFAVGGRGDYRIRPIHVDDLARLSVAAGAAARRSRSSMPWAPSARPSWSWCGCIRDTVGSHSPDRATPRGRSCRSCPRASGCVLRDVLLTREEYRAMAAGLADTDGAATGATWPSAVAGSTTPTHSGARYANEIERHFR